MTTTPTIPAIPGCTPLGLAVATAFDKVQKVVASTLNVYDFFCLRDGTIGQVIGHTKSKLQIVFKRPHDEFGVIGTMGCTGLVMSLKREEVISDIHAALNKGYSDHLQRGMDRHHEMAQKCATFKLGSKVSFKHPSKGVIVGTVIKVNSKTVQLVTDEQVRWNCGPSLLTEAK